MSTIFQRGGFQSFGQPVKMGQAPIQGQAPTPGPKAVVPAPQSPAAAAQNKNVFIPKSPGSAGCPICR